MSASGRRRRQAYLRPMRRPPVQIVWFKRDLRVHDHAPLAEAAGRGPVLPLYVLEPGFWCQPDASGRHLAFLHESLVELRQELAGAGPASGPARRRGRAGPGGSAPAAPDRRPVVARGDRQRLDLCPRPPRARLGRRPRHPLARAAPDRGDPPPGAPRRLGTALGPADAPAPGRRTPAPDGRARHRARRDPADRCAGARGRSLPGTPGRRAPGRRGGTAQLPARARPALSQGDVEPRCRRDPLLATLATPRVGHRLDPRGAAGGRSAPAPAWHRRSAWPGAAPSFRSSAGCTGTATSSRSSRASPRSSGAASIRLTKVCAAATSGTSPPGPWAAPAGRSSTPACACCVPPAGSTSACARW